MAWITCPGCGLNHTPRPDGTCPRCHARVAAAGLSGASEPLPTQPYGGAPARPVPAGQQRAEAQAVTVGSLVSRTFSTWWAHVGKFSALLVVAYLPLIVVFAAVGFAQGGKPFSRPEDVMANLPALLVGGLVTGILGVAVYGGVISGSLQHLAGRPAAFGQMLSIGFRRWWPLFAVSFGASILIMLGMLLLIVPGIIVALGLVVCYPIAVAERVDGMGSALKRSFALTKGSRGTIFGAVVVLLLVTWLGSVAGSLLTAAASLGAAVAIGALLVNMAVQIALGSLLIVFSAVAYHDLRLAKEGVDTSQLAAVFE